MFRFGRVGLQLKFRITGQIGSFELRFGVGAPRPSIQNTGSGPKKWSLKFLTSEGVAKPFGDALCEIVGDTQVLAEKTNLSSYSGFQ